MRKLSIAKFKLNKPSQKKVIRELSPVEIKAVNGGVLKCFKSG